MCCMAGSDPKAKAQASSPLERHSTSSTATGPPATLERRLEKSPVEKAQEGWDSEEASASAQSSDRRTPMAGWAEWWASDPQPREEKKSERAVQRASAPVSAAGPLRCSEKASKRRSPVA